jgi:DNA-binding NtrC family response regulator
MILATNQNLEEMVKKGQFREDLYYRINVISVTQPPLRDRIGDIPLLIEHYLHHFNEQTGKHVTGFDEGAMQLLQRYSWPGNVRELVNVVERSVVLARGSVVTATDLPEVVRRDENSLQAFALQSAGGLKTALAAPEKQILLDALEANGWNRQNTARSLGINRTTLYKKMKKYNIEFENSVA